MGELVYRNYDQQALDDQLNNRKRVPTYEAHINNWADSSAEVRQSLACELDIAVGSAPGEKLDLFPVPGRSDAPILAFIHGGYWQFLDKSHFSFLAEPFVKAGIAYASLNYDLAPGVEIREMTRQVRAQVAWLAREGGAYGIDPTRISAGGHSAGGHLAAMLAVDGWQGDFGLDRHPVGFACSVSGLYELDPIHFSYQQEVLQLDAAQVAEQSPVRLSPKGAAPLICAVGGDESEVFLDQQAEFAAAWGDKVEQVPLPGRNHFTAIHALGEADHPLFQAVRDRTLG